MVAIVARTDDAETIALVDFVNHLETQQCVEVERNFLQTLEGGCTAPIGAFAEMIEGEMRFRGRICSLNGEDEIATDEVFTYNKVENFGEKIAFQVLEMGGRAIMNEIKSQ